MRRVFGHVLTAVLVTCALVVTIAVVRREFGTSPAMPVAEPREIPEPRPVPNWRDLTTAGLWIGHQDAPVLLVQFADFQCPFCAVEARNVRDVLESYGDDVAMVFRHFPLEQLHPHAYEAAVAAECAAAQGRFGIFHDLLFYRQDEIGQTRWTQFADAASADTVAFAKCMEDAWPRARVAEDVDDARKIGLTGTPSVILDGLLLPGTPTVATLRRHIDQALAADQASTRGSPRAANRGSSVADAVRRWASGPWIDVDAEETKATQAGFLQYVGEVSVGASGSIYVVERERDEVLVFDSALTYMHALPNSADITSVREIDGDSVFLFDFDSKHATVRARGREEVARRFFVPSSSAGGPYDVWKLGFTTDVLVKYRRAFTPADTSGQERSDVFRLVGESGLAGDSVLSFPSPEMLLATQGGGFSVARHPFGAKSYVRLLRGHRLVLARSNAFDIAVIDLENNEKLQFSFGIEAVPVPDDEVQQAAARESSAMAAQLLADAPYARPVLAGTAIDNQRELVWVGVRTPGDFWEWAAFDLSAAAFDLSGDFDLSGTHRASVRLPAGLVVVGVWQDRLVGLEYARAPFDPVLKSYRLREPVPT